MSDKFHYRTLKPLDLTDMYLAFLDAFSDYPVEFRLSKEQFVRKFVQKLKIDFSLSIGGFDASALAGFVFTSINHYKGVLTAYNGGTGVRPAYRGNKLTAIIYEYLIPLLQQRKVKQCVLEVLVENEKAIKTYSSIGFKKSNYFKCFKLSSASLPKRATATDLDIFSVKKPDWNTYEKFANYVPSFLDCRNMINENIANEQIIEARHDHKCIGYAIYQPSFGRISQIAVHPDFREQGIGSAILRYVFEMSHQKALTVINIDTQATDTLAFFQHSGFENQLNQYEMILPLD